MQTKMVDIAVTSIDSAVNIQLQETLKSVSAYSIQRGQIRKDQKDDGSVQLFLRNAVFRVYDGLRF